MDIAALGLRVEGIREINRVTRALDDLKSSAKSAETTVKKPLTGFDHLAARAAREAEHLANEVRKLSAYEIRSNDIKAYGNELDRLRAKYNPLFAASKAYENELDEINRAHRVGAINAVEHANALDMLNAKFAQTTAASAGARFNYEQLGGSMSGLAAQFQDIGVTAAMGMNPLIVGLQQGTQIAGQMEAAMARGASATAVFTSAFKSLLGPVTAVSIGLTVLATAVIQAVDWASVAETALNGLAYAVEALAPAAALTGAALAVMFAPSILSGAATLATTIGTTLLSAVKAVGVAAAANPLGALIVGVGAALTAMYVFRDEIKEIFGVDLIGTIKGYVNTVIGLYNVGYEELKYIFSNFPAVIGEASVGAVNLVINSVNSLINVATSGIDYLISQANKVPGVNIGNIGGSFNIGTLENPFTALLEDAKSDRNKAMAEAIGFDYVGSLVDGAKRAGKAASGYLRGLLGGDEDEETGGSSKNEFDETYIANMRERIALLGKETEQEQLLAKIRIGSIKFATQAEEDQAIALAKSYDETTKLLNARAELDDILASSASAVEKETAAFTAQVQVLRDAQVSASEYGNALAKISSATVTDAPRFGGLDATIGGPAGEFMKIGNAEDELDTWYADQMAKQQSFLDQKLINEQLYAERVAEIDRMNAERREQLQSAHQVATLSMFSSMTQGTMDMLQAMGKESSGIYKAMFLANKAASIAMAIVNTEEAATKALAMGPILGIPASTLIRALGYTSVATMAATTVAGMAHDGIDSVPKTGTWLLEKGERVTTAQTSAKMDSVLNRIDSRLLGGTSSPVSGAVKDSPKVTVNVHNAPEGTRVEQRQVDREYIIDVMLDDAMSGGRYSEFGERRLGWSRQGT